MKITVLKRKIYSVLTANMNMDKNINYCLIHKPGSCIHGDYDYSFCDAMAFGELEVEDVKFIAGRYKNQNPGDYEVASLLTRKYGAINSGSKSAAASAKRLKMEIDKQKSPVKVHMIIYKIGPFKKPICTIDF